MSFRNDLNSNFPQAKMTPPRLNRVKEFSHSVMMSESVYLLSSQVSFVILDSLYPGALHIQI